MSHARSFVTKTRMRGCVVIILLWIAICGICIFGGSYQQTLPNLFDESSGMSLPSESQLWGLGELSESGSESGSLAGNNMELNEIENVEEEDGQRLQTAAVSVAAGAEGDPQWVIDLMEGRKYIFATSCVRQVSATILH
eukprot:SAG11_NODE_1925_length_4056_cov_3.841547_5_plen_139_part_00